VIGCTSRLTDPTQKWIPGLARAYTRAESANRSCGQKRQGVVVAEGLRGTSITCGEIGSRLNRFGIAANKGLQGGRGFKSLPRASQQPHLVSCADFFLVPKLLISFLEIKHFKRRGGKFFRRNKLDRRASRHFRRFIFSPLRERGGIRKNVAKFPGGGEGYPVTGEDWYERG